MKRFPPLCLLAALFLTLAAVSAGGAANDAFVEAPRCIALTFDDGPSPQFTQPLLDGLRQRGVRATFFLIGDQLGGMEDVVRQMAEDGHQIGNHTYSHARLDGCVEAGLAELRKTDALLRELLGGDEYWIRPPWGFVSAALRARTETPLIYWSVDPEDWRVRNEELIYHYIVSNARDGDIVLLHDSYDTTVNAVLRAIDTLLSQGYCFVTVEELFAVTGAEALPGRFYMRPDTEVPW